MKINPKNSANLTILSLEYEVIQAVKKLFEKEKVKIYNLQIFNDIEKLNTILLPKIKTIIESQELFYYTNSINYDIDKFVITNYFNHNKEQITIEMKYFSSKFKITILFDNNFKDDDFANGIVDFFEKTVIQKIALYEWNTDLINIDKISKWIKEVLQEKTLAFKINEQTLTVGTDKIILFGINYEKITNKKIKINFVYNNTIFKICLIKLEDWITNEDLIQNLNEFFQKKFVIDLPLTLNYKNFSKEFDFEKHSLKIHQLLKDNNFQIRETKIDFTNNSFKFNVLNDKELSNNLNPWIRFITLPMLCELNKNKLAFAIKAKFTTPIDYQEIKSNFLKKIESLTITSQKFLNQSPLKIKTMIKEQIIKHFDGKLSIDKKDYSFNLNETLVEDFQVNNDEKLVINIFEKLVNNEKMTLIFPLSHFRTWMINEVINHLEIFNRNNPFDLKYQLNEENTWNDVFRLVSEKIPFSYFKKDLISKIIFINMYQTDLSTKIKDDQFEYYQLFKIIKIKYKDAESKQIEIDFKNLLISQDFKDVNEFSRDIKTNFDSMWNDLYPIWKIGEKIDQESLGININSQDKIIKIDYWIEKINEIEGKVAVKAIFSKNRSTKTLILNVNGFLTISSLIQIIKRFFDINFDYSKHQLSTKELHKKAHNKIQELLKNHLNKNYLAISSLKFLSDENEIINNYELESGDYFKLKINIKGQEIALTFKAINVRDIDIFNFIKDFIKDQTCEQENLYPGFKLNHQFKSFPFEINIPNNPEKLLISYEAFNINYGQGIVKFLVNVQHQVSINGQLKTVSQDQFKMTINGFANNEFMKQKLLTLNKSFPYQIHKLSTRDLRFKAQENITSLIKDLVGDFSYQGISSIVFFGNESKKLVNTKNNHGDIVECKITFGDAEELNLKINFSDIFEGDILNLFENFEVDQITTKNNFYIKDWSVGHAINNKDLGIAQPKDLLGCFVIYEISEINAEQGTLIVEVLIKKKFSKHLFFINVSGYGKPLSATKFIDWINQMSTNENILKIGFDVNQALNLETSIAEDAFDLIKHDAVAIFGNNDHLFFKIDDLNIVNNKNLNSNDLLKYFLLEKNSFGERIKINYQIINKNIDNDKVIDKFFIIDKKEKINNEILYLKNWKNI